MTENTIIDNINLQKSFCRLLARARHRSLEVISEELKTLGISSTQWSIVVALAEGLASTSAKLSHLLDYDAGAMTRLIDKLVKKNIVTRSKLSSDKRSTKISLTEEGLRLYPLILPRIANANNTLLNGFSQEEIETLNHLLNKIVGIR